MAKSIIPLICITFLIGCSVSSAPSQNANTSLLFDTTCSAPCTLGITPGVTSMSQARIIVNQSTLLSGCIEHDLRSQGGVQWIDCNAKSFDMVFSDDLIGWIIISPSNMNVSLLIQKYGVPDTVGIIIGSRPDEAPRSKAILVYNKIRTVVTLIEEPGDKYEITPNSQIEAITFNSEQEQAKVTTKVLDAWRGFGIYSP